MYQKFSHPEWKKTLNVRTKDLPEPPKAFQNQWLRKVRFVLDTTSFKVDCQDLYAFDEMKKIGHDFRKY